jgi:hypothetical protein
MKKLALPILIAFSLTFLMIGMLSAQSDVLTLESSKGNVTYPHKQHADAFKCVDCHHKTEAGGKPKACGECHKKGAEVTAMKAFHSKTAPNSCRGCHEKEGNGPKYTPCSNCHKK